MLLVPPGTDALSCAAPEFSYERGEYLTGDVLVVEGRGWSRGSDDDCDASPFDDIHIYMAPTDGDRLLVADGAADHGGGFVAAVRIPPTLSGTVTVEVVASASPEGDVRGVTTSSPLRVRERIAASAVGVQPVTFGPAERGPAVWPWVLLAVVASALAGAFATWRIARRVEARRVASSNEPGDASRNQTAGA